MKRKLITMLAALGMSVAGVAQLGPVSLGAELALPTGDFGESYPLGYGASLGYEQPIGEKLGVTLQVGYIMLGIDDAVSTLIDKSSMMPIQVGAKYYFKERGAGLYAHVQGGVHDCHPAACAQQPRLRKLRREPAARCKVSCVHR